MRPYLLLAGLLLFAFAARASRAQDNLLTPGEKKQGWILLFDGKTQDNWMTSDQKPSQRPIENNCINPHKCGAYMLVHKQLWENFVLQCDFKLTKDCNSGIFLRTWPLIAPQGRDVGWNGFECQILDSPTAGYQDTAAIYDLCKPESYELKPLGEWNHIQIICNHNLIFVELNGRMVTRMDLDDFTEAGRRPDGGEDKFDWVPKDRPRKGYIGLQDHGGDCWYKNIKIRPLP